MREAEMIEPLFGLFVAVALGIYLVVTLLRPERF
jgi:K+-transporting ATPase KdpF subunit